MRYIMKQGLLEGQSTEEEIATCIVIKPPLDRPQIRRLANVVLRPSASDIGEREQPTGDYTEIWVQTPIQEDASEKTFRLTHLIGYMLREDDHTTRIDERLHPVEDSSDLFEIDD